MFQAVTLLPTQRARTAQQARDLRLRNAAVASAAAGGRPATARSSTGWIHPPGGRRGIRTGRTYVDQVRGGRRMSSNGGSSATSRRSSGGGGGGRRVHTRLTTRRDQAQHSRRQGRGPGRLRPGSANNRASDGSMAAEARLEADMAAGSRSFTAALVDGGGAASMPRTPMSPLDEQAPAAHDADPASFWLADQASAVVDCESAVESTAGTSSHFNAKLLPSQGLAPVDLQSSTRQRGHAEYCARRFIVLAGGLQLLGITTVQDGPGVTQQGPGAAVVVRPQSASLRAMAVEQGGSPLHPPFQVHSKALSICEVRVNAAA